MTNRAGRVISIALEDKNLVDLMSEERDIFGPVYKDVVEWIGEYSAKYRGVPSIAEVNDNFKENVLEPAPSSGNIKYEIESLREEYVKSELDTMLVKLARNIDKRPSSEILAKMTEKANDLLGLTHKVKDVDITDIDLAITDFQAARKDNEDGGSGIMTGISAWDAALPAGMCAGQFITLMGYSGKGKSFVADYLAAEAYKQGKTVLLGSFEMSASEQRARIFGILANGGFLINDLNQGLVTEGSMRSWGSENLSTGGKIIVVEQDGHAPMTPSSMQSKIDKYRPDLVILDYLQLMMDNAKTKEITPRMMNLSRENKLLATSNDTVVVAIAAVTDDETKKRDSPPRMAQIAWSKAIEYDSDLVVVVHRYEDTPYLEIISRKVRRSDMFGMRYMVDLARGVFEEAYEDDDE